MEKSFGKQMQRKVSSQLVSGDTDPERQGEVCDGGTRFFYNRLLFEGRALMVTHYRIGGSTL